jgi:hypothetical protein
MTDDKPFRFLNSIFDKKEHLVRTDQDAADYEKMAFLTRRGLSQHLDAIFYANEMNLYAPLPGKMEYDYFYHSIRKMKRGYPKWPKKPKTEQVEMLMDYYKVNRKKAEEYLNILSKNDLAQIKTSMELGG